MEINEPSDRDSFERIPGLLEAVRFQVQALIQMDTEMDRQGGHPDRFARSVEQDLIEPLNGVIVEPDARPEATRPLVMAVFRAYHKDFDEDLRQG
jgi:hypothetical protein